MQKKQVLGKTGLLCFFYQLPSFLFLCAPRLSRELFGEGAALIVRRNRLCDAASVHPKLIMRLESCAAVIFNRPIIQGKDIVEKAFDFGFSPKKFDHGASWSVNLCIRYRPGCASPAVETLPPPLPFHLSECLADTRNY
jgi:hypothetical protein